jgi:hypothetical protein
MLYHDGPVIQGTANVYMIFYGDWPTTQNNTIQLIDLFILNLGANSPYFRINTTYPDSLGNTPSGILFFGSNIVDRSYAHGSQLAPSDIEEIITDHIIDMRLPLDPSGIYLVVTSPEIESESTGFCQPGVGPYHSSFGLGGAQVKYISIGNPMRCPRIAAPQFVAPDGSLLPTPNGDFVADAMAGNIASALNSTLTNPLGTAWFDQFGVESGDKCLHQFGQTYSTPNGARANIRLSGFDYLIPQNWVNTNIGYCALAAPQ